MDSRPENREIVTGDIPKPVNPVHIKQYGNVWTCFTCPIELNGSTAAGIGARFLATELDWESYLELALYRTSSNPQNC